MTKLPTPIRPLLALAALAAVALPASGCGTSTADVAHGRVLFIQKCGVCHELAEAGTTAKIGRNLDEAFAAAREAGEGGETIEGVVEAQVESPRPSNGNPAVSMPPHVVEGQDLDDVAAYVGMYAGVPGAAPAKVPGGAGAQIFAGNGCGGCHALAAAKAGGTTGPNLDEVLPGPEHGDGRKVDRGPQRDHRQGLPRERDARHLRRNPEPEGNRTAGRIPDRGNRRGSRPRARRPRLKSKGG